MNLPPISHGQISRYDLRDLLRADARVILEIGAHHGEHTKRFLRSFRQATIHAFEPDPRCLAKFKVNIINPRTRLHEMAIGAKDGNATFHVSSGMRPGTEQAPYSRGWDQSGSLRAPKTHKEKWPWCKFEQTITVTVRSLDSWAREHGIGAVDFIWADMQGAEGDLIAGGHETLVRTRYIHTEYSNEEIYEGGPTLQMLLDMLPNFRVLKKTIPRLAAALLLAASTLPLAIASLPANAQDAPRARSEPDTTPLAEPDMPAIIKGLGLVESKLPAREFIKGWHPPKKIVVQVGNNVHRLDWLKEVVPSDVQLVAVRSPEEAIKEVADADAYIGICSKDLVDAGGPNFRWVHVNVAGVDDCFVGDNVPAKLKDGTVAVTNSQKVTGVAVADNAIAAMMALSRGMDEYARMDMTGNFTTEPYPRLQSLQGKTILIAGLGGIGTAMANLAHGIGMRVIATNGSIPKDAPDYIEHIGLPDELSSMIGQADVVMVALPLTNQTQHLFDAAMFARMKKGAIFVNDTREEIEVDEDLAAAVKSGQLSSASVDSRLRASPIIGVKNILVTPYIASQNVDEMLGRGGETIWYVARENLRRYAIGDKMLSVVDPAKGY